MRYRSNSINKQDIYIFLVFLVFVLGIFFLDNTCYWGDDFAAYLSEGMAIVDGKFDLQVKLNLQMHPSTLPKAAVEEGKLVYVWGYPLILAIIYKIFGFNNVTFNSITYYKLPSLLALALIGGTLYLLFKRRFNRRLSFILALIFCTYQGFFDFIDTLCSDIVFLFFFILTLYLAEVYLSLSSTKKRCVYGAFLGVFLWLTYEIRLNGIAALFTVILAHLFDATFKFKLTMKKKNHTELFSEFVPYLVFCIFLFAANAFLPSATKADDFSFAIFLPNLKYYTEAVLNWLGLLFINPLIYITHISEKYTLLMKLVEASGCLALIICILGIATADVKKNIHFLILIVVYFFSVCVLPYRQGSRYIYPILPIILLYFGYGMQYIFARMNLQIARSTSKKLYVNLAMCTLATIFFIFPIVKTDLSLYHGEEKGWTITSNISGDWRYNIYSETPVRLYNYIRKNTPENCTIAFFKPRALYLNTGRISIPLDVNGHTLDEADYCLIFNSEICVLDDENIRKLNCEFELVYKDEPFELYMRK